jgi:hypothetical protein
LKTTRTLDEAIEQGYVVIRGSYKVSNALFRHCEKTDAPFVRVALKTTFASVQGDLFGQSYMMSEHACKEIHDLLKANHVGRWGWHLSTYNRTFMYSPRIPMEQAATVAKGIVDILAKPGYREPNIWRSSQLVEDLDRALRDGKLLEVADRGAQWHLNLT